MTDSPNRLYFDQDADARLAEALGRQGFDVETALQAGRSEADDLAQLTYATQTERVLVTHNVHHFPNLHASWLANGQDHPGIIILLGYPPVGDWVRRALNLLKSFSKTDLRNQLVYLGAEFDER